MPRSGSTVHYQLTADLVESQGIGKRVGYVDPLSLEALESLENEESDDKFLVVKCHNYSEQAADLISSGKGKAIYVYRDIRDAMVSYMNRCSISFEEAMRLDGGFVETTLSNYYKWNSVDTILVSQYEDMVDHLKDEVIKISDFLGLKITDEIAISLARKHTLIQEFQHIRHFDYEQEGTQINNTHWEGSYDPKTQLHQNHIRSGKQQQWKYFLSSYQLLQAEAIAHEWLNERGYPLSQEMDDLSRCEFLLNRTQDDLASYQAKFRKSHNEIVQLRTLIEKSHGELEQSQSQLHQTQEELQQSQSQLHQTQGEVQQYQNQLHQTQEVLEQFQDQMQQAETLLQEYQGQLHSTQTELEQSQSHLHSTQAELEQSQSQLRSTEAVLEQSQSQLYQNRAELAHKNSQLHQSEWELERTRFQLHQTQAELAQSQAELVQCNSQVEHIQLEAERLGSQIGQVQGELEQSQSKLRSSSMELKRSHSQLVQVLGELEQSQAQQRQREAIWQQSQSQKHQLQNKLKRSYSQLVQVQEESQHYQSQLVQVQEESQNYQSQLVQVQEELDRSHFQQYALSDQGVESQIPYTLLVRDAWYAYQSGDLKKMQQCLQESFKITPISRTESVVNWLESFCQFSAEKGQPFDTYSLTNSQEWKQLVGLTIAQKVGRYR